MIDLPLHTTCWYSGQDNRLVSSGRIVYLVGNGGGAFRRRGLYFVISGTHETHQVALWNGSHSGHAAWVHPRHLKRLDGHCACGQLKPYGDYLCIKCRSRA